MNETTLCIGDPHCIADDPDMGRFKVLGDFIADTQPDNIVQIGDFLTYDSISAWNNAKRLSMEGQRLSKELESGADAYNLLMEGIRKLNDRNRANRKATYRPNMYWLLGNHEDRAERYVEQNPEMKGLVFFNRFFDPTEEGWEIVEYREHCEFNGVMFTHIPMSGNNQPMSSKHLVKNVVSDYNCSIVFGHTHKLAFESDGMLSPDGVVRRTALNVGCYFDHMPDYASGSRGTRDWWPGVVLLHHLNYSGDYDLETIHIDRLREMYG